MNMPMQEASAEQENILYGQLKTLCAKVPHNLKITMVASYVIGLIAHAFCYTNTYFCQDAAAIYCEPISWAEAAGGSRWLMPLLFAPFDNLQMPWLEGVVTLFIYGIAAWLVCEALQVHRGISVVLVTGLMVTYPTMTASNCLLSSAHIYALALLFACLAVYAQLKWRFGALWAFVFMLLCDGSYAAYISVAVGLFLVSQILAVLRGNIQNIKKMVVGHFAFAAAAAFSLLGSYGIMWLMLRGDEAATQTRVIGAAARSLYDYFGKVLTTYYTTLDYYWVTTKNSFLQNEKCLYVLFLLGMLCALIAVLTIIVKKQLYKKPLPFALLAVDVLVLPLGMNILSILDGVHMLMMYSFILPWLFFVAVDEAITDAAPANSEKGKKARLAYSVVTLVISVTTILYGIRLANEAYLKEYNLNEAGLAVVNRIADRMESTENYVPGETPVYFVGDVRAYYATGHEAYAAVGSIYGVGSGWYDTALTYYYPFVSYLQQQLNLNVSLATAPYYISAPAAEYAEHLKRTYEDLDVEEFTEKFEAAHAFPAQDCCFWMDDVLVVIIGK